MADNGSQAHGDTYSAARTAEILNLGKRRVLQMLERGELPATKDDMGRWLVSAPHVHTLLRERQQDQDRGKRTKDAAEQSTTPPANEIGRELLDSFKDQVQHLRHELTAEREANRENRRIIAGLIERIPELASPSDERESPETPADKPQGTQAPEPRPTPQKPVQRRSWWQRIVGG